LSGGDWKQMFKAIQNGDLELVKYYLKIGIDPNYQHPEYMALPISESIRYDHIEITKVLLEFGADLSIIEMESGCNPIELATRLKNKKALEILH